MSDHEGHSVPIKPSEITPQHVYCSRREFMKVMGIAGAGSVLAACVAPGLDRSSRDGSTTTLPPSSVTAGMSPAAASETPIAAATPPSTPHAAVRTDELGDALTPYEAVVGNNNYYEFTTSKKGVGRLAENFEHSPWQVDVGGLVQRPRTFGLEDLLRLYRQEEHVYRMRCVEAWSMVIPWQGFPLSLLLRAVEPTGDARFVRFETVYRPEEMPGQIDDTYPWPYCEGLRLDEAMHGLTILATGLYGQELPAQNGAPVRLVVPWKYGFKSIKSVAKIELVEHQPATFWSSVAPREYGFYSNVNPNVSHPRWSQAAERRFGEATDRNTLVFNGYAEEVAGLYAGMDLRENF